MDKLLHASRTALRAVWAATVWVALALWAAVRWTARTTWAATKWAGRVALWLVCWPLGLWRSFRHGQRKRDARFVQALRDAA